MRLRSRLAWFVAGVLMSFAASAQAQTAAPEYPTWEISGGYQLLHVPDQTLPFGLNLDGAINMSKAFGLVAEGGWATDSEDEDGVSARVHAWNIGVGPRWNARPAGSVWPYAQVLFGGLFVHGSAEVDGVDVDVPSSQHFMIQPGAGVYINAGDGWGWQVSGDYRRVFLDEEEFGESGENEFRFYIGIRLLLD